MLNEHDDKKPAIATAAASKKAAKAKELPRNTFMRPVRIPLTKEELLERADQLVQEGNLIVSLEAQKAAEAKRIGGDIAQAEGRAAVLRYTIHDRHETRSTECYEEWADGETLTRRCDTDEIVARKPCPQRPLAIDDVPSGIDDTRDLDKDGNEKKSRKKAKR